MPGRFHSTFQDQFIKILISSSNYLCASAARGSGAATLSVAGDFPDAPVLEALGRSHPGAQLEPGWPRFLGGKCFQNHSSPWRLFCAAGKAREWKTAASVRNWLYWSCHEGVLCLVKFKLKINYGRALNLLSGVVLCLDVNSETPMTSLRVKCDTAKAGFPLLSLMCNYSIFYCIMQRRVLIIEPD